MPPKKKKSTPVVVGTVSTRSTRRESIVNIKIIPKASKSVARTSTPKNASKKSLQTSNNEYIEQEKIVESEKTRPEILEILKDWSDDENSRDDSLLSDSSRNLTVNKNEHNSSSLPVDQQSLIDILEGNHLEPQQPKSLTPTIEYEHKQKSQPNVNKLTLAKELIVDNPIVNIDSPQIEESEVIEECVVEDDGIIIELSQEQLEITPQDYKLESSHVAPRLQNQVQGRTVGCLSNNTENKFKSELKISKDIYFSSKKQNQFNANQVDNEIKKKKDANDISELKQVASDLDEGLQLSTSCRVDEESQSMTSEDTTSQSMITVQDEDACDINDIQISDNSSNNYEVIEEHVVFDTSEIIENFESIHPNIQLEKNHLLEGDELIFGVQKVDKVEGEANSKEKSNYQPVNVRHSSNSDNLSANILEQQHTNILQETGVLELSNKGYQDKVHKGYLVQGRPTRYITNTMQSSSNLLSSAQKRPARLDNIIKKKSEESTLGLMKKPIKVKSETEETVPHGESARNTSISTLLRNLNEISQNSITEIKDSTKTTCISNQEDSVENKKQSIQLACSVSGSKSDKEDLNISEIQLQVETKSLVAQIEENSLCQKVNKCMTISKESGNVRDSDPASDKLQEGMKKMFIQEKYDQTDHESTESETDKESKSLRYCKQNFNKESESEEPKLTSVQEKQKGKTPKSGMVYYQTEEGEKSIDSDTEKIPKSSGRKSIFGINTNQRRRSTRKKPLEDEGKHFGTDRQEESFKIENISNKEILNFEMNESHERSFQYEELNMQLKVKSKRNEKKEDSELYKFEVQSKISDVELNADKDEKSFKHLKGNPKKALGKLAQHVIKMDVDSESSEAKTSETEGDSTSNESSQSSNSTKMYKTRAKRVLLNPVGEFSKMDTGSNLEGNQTENKHDFNMDISADGNSQNKKSKETFTKTKKATRKVLDGEVEKTNIDLKKSFSTSDLISVKNLQADIDATIDEVLRKYTQDESGISDECASLKELKIKVVKPTKDSKKKKEVKSKKDEKYDNSEEVRRSDRIKTILPVKKKSHGLVRSKSEPAMLVEAENSDSNSVHSELDKVTPVSPQLNKKYKTKSKAKSSENLQIISLSGPGPLIHENSPPLPKAIDLKTGKSGKAEIESRLKSFTHLKENQYKTDRQVCKEAREMICDCYLAEEDIQKDEYGCGEDCLNRLLMIECGYLCQIGDRCTNKKFQKGQFAPVEVFKTEKKGLGLIAAANIPYGEFILEYVGEVLNPEEFDKRAEVYSKDKNIHFYFMSLRADAIIDATMKGNISRFINHSCDPNAETQKWTVNGELRIGFFSTRTILAGEEITFDYKFQRYGKEAQKCYCGASICRGWLGERPDESEDEDEEEEEEAVKAEQIEIIETDVKVPTLDPLEMQGISVKELTQERPVEKMETDAKAQVAIELNVPAEAPATTQVQETPKKVTKKKPRKELMFEDFDQLNEDIDMVVTTGLKNQAHTLKLSRLMVRAKDLDQRKKLLRVLRRGELPCRRLFLDYHGLRLMHGYMIDAQQLTNNDKKLNYSQLEFLQTKLELLQTLAVLPIQNKTMLIESKVLPAVEKWAKNEDLVEDIIDQKDVKKYAEEMKKQENTQDPAVIEKIDEIKFLASKLLEEWVNLKESFRIPKKQRIEQMKEHEKEANRKFVETSYAQEKESSRKNDQRYRTWSRYKSEREINKKGPREDKDKPSAEYLKMSKHERRKLFALQMELKEEERRLKQREMWRQHEMNCMLIGADPRFTAPFDPSKGFQYIWNPSIGQWQALPVPSAQNQGVYNSPATSQGTTGFNLPPTSQGYTFPPTHKPNLLGPYAPSLLSVPGITGPAQQYPAPQKNNFNTGATCDITRGMQPNIAPMVPGLSTPVSTMTNTVPGITAPIPGITGLVPGMAGTLHGLPGSTLTGSVPGITQPPIPALPLYPEVKQLEEDPSQVKFAGPIPPPVKLPPKWKCAKDKYGRPYYYHVKVRKSQWEPPPLSEEVEEFSDTSSSETSTLSSSDSSSDSETEDEMDDTKLLMEVRKQMESTSKLGLKSPIPLHIKKEEKDSATPSPDGKVESDNEDEPIEELKEGAEDNNSEELSSIDIRLKEQFNLDSSDPPKKKRRIGLCQEIIISPRTEEDRQQFKEDLKRYKATKEKLKRQKEQMLHQAKKKLKTSSGTTDSKKSRDKRLLKSTAKSRIKQVEWNDEHAKKIKEVFRSSMATTVVGVLNAYRKPDCKESRITNTEDFKHLARKLTHFVMLKEMKHINTIDELICTDNVKAKAREYIKKYMSKFGEVYQKRQDEPDFKD